MKCNNCNFENPDGAKFCQECGRGLKTTITCPKCHAEYEQGAKFCQQCGTSLTRETKNAWWQSLLLFLGRFMAYYVPLVFIIYLLVVGVSALGEEIDIW